MGFFNKIKSFMSNIGQKVKQTVRYGIKRAKQFAEPAQAAEPPKSVYNELPDEDKIAAILANQAYQPEADRLKEYQGYILDPELNKLKTAVYNHPGTKHTYIAHRGTKLDMDDLIRDKDITLGNVDNFKASERYQNAKQIRDAAVAKYGRDITNVGHSLGGYLTNKISQEYNDKGVTFNAGSSVSDINLNDPCKRENPPGYCKNIKHYRTRSDIVSGSLGGQGNVTTLDNKENNNPLAAHLLSNFLPQPAFSEKAN
jgi:hypothetical protein